MFEGSTPNCFNTNLIYGGSEMSIRAIFEKQQFTASNCRKIGIEVHCCLLCGVRSHRVRSVLFGKKPVFFLNSRYVNFASVVDDDVQIQHVWTRM